MPPKKTFSSKRKSTNRIHTKETIPIFEILTNPDTRQPINELIPQIQQCLKQNPYALKFSFLKMLVSFCGLQKFSSNISIDDSIASLKDIIQLASNPNKNLETPLILDSRLKLSSQISKRLKQFYQLLLGDQLNIVNDQKIQFNQSFSSWLQLLTHIPVRQFRHAAVKITKIFVQQQINHYEKLHQQKNSKKALQVSKIIAFYQEKIISLRLSDVDSKIREIAFQLTQKIMIELQSDLLNESFINKIFTPLFLSEDLATIDRALQLLHKLLTKCKKNNQLIDYLTDKRYRLQQASRNSSFTGASALRVIGFLYANNPQSGFFNKNYIITIFEIYAREQASYNLNVAIQNFYSALYDNEQKLQQNSTLVLIEIIQILLGITNSKYLNFILKSFYTNNKKIESNKIFDIDNMFHLLMNQSYTNFQGKKIKLKKQQIQILLIIMIQYVKFCSIQFKTLIKQKKLFEDTLQKYNNHILINSKQLIFKKMTDKKFQQKYLKLFSNLHIPTLNFSSLETYLDFVIDKINLLFEQSVNNFGIFKEIVNIYYNLKDLQDSDIKYNHKKLIMKIRISQLLDINNQMLDIEVVYKVSAIMTKFPIHQLSNSTEFVSKLIKNFARTITNDNDKIQVLLICHLIHHHKFIELFQSPSQNSAQTYRGIRNKILDFFIQVLNSNDESSIVKLTSFRGLIFTLKQVCNSMFQELPQVRIAHELNQSDMKTIYGYVSSHLFSNSEHDSSSEFQLTRMMHSMSFEDHEIKSQILKLLFDLFESSYFFTCTKQSAVFIAFLLKGQMTLEKDTISAKFYNSAIDINKLAQKLLNKLLNDYITDEINPKHKSKFIYWRLCQQIFSLTRQDQKFDIILQKLINTYLSTRKKDSQTTKRANDKLMLFVITAVDKILQKKQYINLDIYQNIFRRIYRRYQKDTLIRIKESYLSKAIDIDSPHVKSFIDFLQTVSKVVIKKSKKEEQDVKSEENESQEQEQMQMRNPQDKKKRQNRLKNSQRVMQVQEPQEQILPKKINTRSATKKKVR